MKTRWVAESTGCMDFGRQISTGATDTFLGAITFFAPALCWWARTIVLPIWAYSLSASAASPSKIQARHHAYFSTHGECESPSSHQSVRADRARECPRDNGRALSRQRGDYPWQSLRRFPPCGGQLLDALPLIITESVAFSGHETYLQLVKEKGFSSKKNDVPQMIKC